MPIANERGKERRWIVLAEAPDGRYVTLGRESDPTDAEIAIAEDGLRAQGLTGWLAIMQGNPYVGDLPRLMEVRPLAAPEGTFADAAAACVEAIRAARAAVKGC